MTTALERRIANSDRELQRVGWPCLQSLLGWYHLASAVAETGAFGRGLDIEHGIDYVARNRDGVPITFAWRVQWGPAHNTFSLREREVGKLLDAYLADGTLSSYTVHAYVERPPFLGSLTSLGVVKTRALCRHIVDNPWVKKRRRFNYQDRPPTPFVWVTWAEIECEARWPEPIIPPNPTVLYARAHTTRAQTP